MLFIHQLFKFILSKKVLHPDLIQAVYFLTLHLNLIESHFCLKINAKHFHPSIIFAPINLKLRLYRFSLILTSLSFLNCCHQVRFLWFNLLSIQIHSIWNFIFNQSMTALLINCYLLWFYFHNYCLLLINWFFHFLIFFWL